MITKRWTDIVLLWRYKRDLYLNVKSAATEENLMGKPVLIHFILILFVFFPVIILYFFPKVLRPFLVLIKTRSCWRYEDYCWIKQKQMCDCVANRMRGCVRLCGMCGSEVKQNPPTGTEGSPLSQCGPGLLLQNICESLCCYYTKRLHIPPKAFAHSVQNSLIIFSSASWP